MMNKEVDAKKDDTSKFEIRYSLFLVRYSETKKANISADLLLPLPDLNGRPSD